MYLDGQTDNQAVITEGDGYYGSECTLARVSVQGRKGARVAHGGTW